MKTAIVLFYAALASIAGVLIFVFDRSRYLALPAYGIPLALSLILPPLLAISVTYIEIFVAKWFKTPKELDAFFFPIVKNWSHPTIAFAALSSGIAEELLFRAFLLPATGLVISSVLFGLMHFAAPQIKFFYWALYATLLGFMLGALTLGTNSWLAAALTHILINYIGFRRLKKMAQ